MVLTFSHILIAFRSIISVETDVKFWNIVNMMANTLHILMVSTVFQRWKLCCGARLKNFIFKLPLQLHEEINSINSSEENEYVDYYMFHLEKIKVKVH